MVDIEAGLRAVRELLARAAHDALLLDGRSFDPGPYARALLFLSIVEGRLLGDE